MGPVLLRIAARSVRRNWRHSVGAALAVAVGFAAITLFGGYMADMRQLIGEMMEERFMMGTLIVEGKGASAVLLSSRGDVDPVMLHEREQAFVEEYLREHAAEVVARARSLFIDGVVSNGRASTPFSGWGYDPAEGAAIRRRFAWDAWNGKPLSESPADSVLLANGLGRLLDCVPMTKEPPFDADGLPVAKVRPFECRMPRLQLMGSTSSGQVNAVTATVAGLTDAGRKEMDFMWVAMPLALAQRLGDTRDVSMVTVLLRDPSTGARFAGDLAAAAAARGLEVDAIPWQQHYFGLMYRQAMDFFGVMRGLMAVVILAIAGTAVFSTMAKAVNERTREIGTLRSLGFLRWQVTALFAIEAAILSAGACVAGLLVTLGVTFLVDRAGLTYNPGTMASPIPLGVAVDPAGYLQVALFLVGISVLAAWRPARRAARTKIPDALAYA